MKNLIFFKGEAQLKLVIGAKMLVWISVEIPEHLMAFLIGVVPIYNPELVDRSNLGLTPPPSPPENHDDFNDLEVNPLVDFINNFDPNVD